MRKVIHYQQEGEEKRKNKQEIELNQVLDKLRRLATQEGGGDAEVEKLMNELEETRQQRDKWMKHTQELKLENQELKNQIKTGGPAVVELGSSKKAKLTEETTGNDEVNKWKRMVLNCLSKDIPTGMTVQKAAFVKILLIQQLQEAKSTEKNHWNKILDKFNGIQSNLNLLQDTFKIQKTSPDMIEMQKDAIEYIIELLKEERPLDIKSCEEKMNFCDNNIQKFQNLVKPREVIDLTKKRPLKDVNDVTECRVCGKVGGRLLCEETHPYRVFCGLVCQSKFYYSSSE